MINHIVHINFSLTIGGIDNMLVDILNEQSKTIKTSLIIINDKIHNEVLENITSRVDVYKINRKEGNKDFVKILKLNWLLHRLRPSVVHCHNSNIINVLLFNKCPKVLTVHDVKYSVKHYHKYDKIYAISKAVKNDIETQVELPVELVYNGVNNKLIKTVESKEKKTGFFDVVVISRLVHEKKGQDLVIKSIRELLNLNSSLKIRVDIIGDGESRQFLEKMVSELKLEESIFFLGAKSRNYIYENLCNYDLLIQPSRYEGFGLTIVEAMFARIPVLVSDIDGPLEITNNGEFGKLFNSGDLKSLVTSLELIIKDYYKFYESYVEKSYDFAMNNFSLDKMKNNYFKNYKKTIESYGKS